VPHAVLLGDSIFDNGVYVPGEPAVVDQLRAALPKDWTVSLLAVDGHLTADVAKQIEALPQHATHLVVSCGGNDALGYLPVLADGARSVADALDRLAGIRADFGKEYRRMLKNAVATRKYVTVCTIYDCIPDLEPAAHTALSMFNEVILREAVLARVAIVDLRLVCTERSDYSALSPIEPSGSGGEKIVAAIGKRLLDAHSPSDVVRIYT
jgi:lysophospholipase L1-like esterase